jgi:hypothetical protein
VTDVGPGGLPPITQDAGDPGGPYFDSTSSDSAPTARSGTPARAGTAKDQAGQVTQDAKESGKQVAGAAVDEGKNVLAEGRRQIRDLTAQAGQQVDEQTRLQKDRASAGLRTLAEELQSIGSGQGGQSGMATDAAQQAAAKVHDIAGWLESREPGQLVEELRGVARRRPGAFLVGAIAAGVVAGRLTRGTVDAARSEEEPAPAGAGQAPIASYGGAPTAGGLDVDLTSTPAATPLQTSGRELYAEADDPLYSSTSSGEQR